MGALVVSGCGDDGGVECNTPASVTYEGHIQSFLTSFCTRCHSSSLSGTARNGAPDNRDYDTFAGIKEVAELANVRIQRGGMPPSGTKPEACSKALFKAWVDQGASER